MTPRLQRLAGLGALGACGAFLALYALLAFISTPKGTSGMDRANATIVYVSVGLVVLALILVHLVLARQLLAAARHQAQYAAAGAAAVAPGVLGVLGVLGDGQVAPGEDAAHDAARGAHHHPTARTYIVVGIVLTVITAVEVSAYYIPAWEGSAIYVPSMLFLSAIKFATVAMVYMHLKYDHKLFRALFGGPFLIAFATLFGLLFLFGKLALRLGMLPEG